MGAAHAGVMHRGFVVVVSTRPDGGQLVHCRVCGATEALTDPYIPARMAKVERFQRAHQHAVKHDRLTDGAAAEHPVLRPV